MENTIIRAPKDRNLFFYKQVTQESICDLTKKLIEIIDDDKQLVKNSHIMNYKYKPEPIKIFIDSYGGNCYQGLGLIPIIENSTTPIHTIVTGSAMSMGFAILISGHKRFAYKYSTPLYHQVSSGFDGKVEDMKICLKETERLQKILEDMTVKKTGISRKKLRNILKHKTDWFMSAEKALKLKVVDEIL